MSKQMREKKSPFHITCLYQRAFFMQDAFEKQFNESSQHGGGGDGANGRLDISCAAVVQL